MNENEPQLQRQVTLSVHSCNAINNGYAVRLTHAYASRYERRIKEEGGTLQPLSSINRSLNRVNSTMHFLLTGCCNQRRCDFKAISSSFFFRHRPRMVIAAGINYSPDRTRFLSLALVELLLIFVAIASQFPARCIISLSANRWRPFELFHERKVDGG